ncbi:MAG: TIGR03619 family F420-dependent LLM class oxidoreductase [Acidimicrobiia bacterium]|nr:TIGR03619 family F420-dependent LLM class oxidoreductase [Acidimicrobiia bacterium]
MTMEIGITGVFGGSPKRDIGFLKEYAVAAEEAGFDCLYAPEHVVFFASYDSKYPYTPDGHPSFPPDVGLYDPLFVCAVASMVTTRLRTATSVMILPERPALLTAKEVMTLDHISGGRFDLGIGIGWSDEEYAALGVPWERRGRRADEYVEAIRAAWSNDVAAYQGEFVQFENAVLRPAPVKGTVPIIVGGDSPAAMRRAARLGDGWYGWWAGVELEPHLAQLRAIMAEEGRDQGPGWSLRVGLPIGGESPDEVAEKAAQAKALGVDEFVVGAGIPSRDFDVHLRRWAEAVSTAR